jgi:glycosyltransferase involved in cell wall biosynthesis
MTIQQNNTKVLMIGPGEHAIGGILSLVETFLPLLRKQVQLSYLPTVSSRQMKDSGVFSFQNICIAISQYVRFSQELIRFRPHIIHIHTSHRLAWLKDTFYIIVGKLFGCAVVLHVHAFELEGFYSNGPLFLHWYSVKMLGLVNLVIAVSEQWRDSLSRIVASQKVHTLTNCIRAEEFSGLPIRGSTGKVNFLFLGSVGLRKGAFDFIEALGRSRELLGDFNAWIVGCEEENGGLDRARKRLQALELEDRCELPGMVIGEEKVRYFQEADVFVFPSYKEGLPIVVLEALAAGLPIISTPVGGIPSVVRMDENGFLIPPGDVTLLAEKMQVLAIDKQLREKMGTRSREIAELEVDVKPYVAKLVSFYQTLNQTG